MIDPVSLTALVGAFDDPSDLAAMKSRELVAMLLEHSPAPLSRRQFTPGHVTCTGLVVHPDGARLLMVHHRRLDRWLLPGGHIEPEDADAAAAARREVEEETGAALLPATAGLAGIDVHGIPGKRDEPYHLHHDLVFALRASSGEVRVSEESRAVAWVREDEWERYAVPGNVRRAWRRILDGHSAITKL